MIRKTWNFNSLQQNSQILITHHVIPLFNRVRWQLDIRILPQEQGWHFFHCLNWSQKTPSNSNLQLLPAGNTKLLWFLYSFVSSSSLKSHCFLALFVERTVVEEVKHEIENVKYDLEPWAGEEIVRRNEEFVWGPRRATWVCEEWW